MSGALEGITVISAEMWAALPGGTAILADWGAEVIKIENPAGGDPVRGLLSLGITDVETDLNPEVEFVNRNKKSIAIDLRHERAREIVYKMVEKADVFACGFVGDVPERLGIDYESLSRLNPKLIYASLWGYPDKSKRGYDIGAFWARSGLMADVGVEPGAPPPPQARGIGDHSMSVHFAGGVAAALFARERTGIGQEVNLCLYRSGVWTNGIQLQSALISGQDQPQISRKEQKNPLYIAYGTKNGKWVQLMMLQTDRYWSGFCQALERPELEKNPKFASHERRMENHIELIAILDEILGTRTREEWGRLFDENGVLWEAVQSDTEVVADSMAWQNEFFVTVDHPVVGKIRLVNSPVRFSKTPSTVRTSAPALGQHTEEVLLGLGYGWDDIVSLKEQGVII